MSETITASLFPVHYSPLQLTRKVCFCVGCKLSPVIAFSDLHKVNHRQTLVQINMDLIIDIGGLGLGMGFVSS